GLDHQKALAVLGRNCDANTALCSMPIRYTNTLNPTTAPWKQGDTKLDWQGVEAGQGSGAQGSPLDWTTNIWPSSWGAKKTVAINGYGETPINLWGQHYWLLDVEMDCSKTYNGWFELKSFISNGPGWEANVAQANTPWVSNNHFAQCGKINVFQRGQSNPVVVGGSF
ncbi:MAG TPA: alpha-amylase, partial [Cellvibrio sp.]|nr:alpha-amylase [Cellvibrio sp.]